MLQGGETEHHCTRFPQLSCISLALITVFFISIFFQNTVAVNLYQHFF